MDNNQKQFKHKRFLKNYLINPRIQGSIITFNLIALWSALGIIYFHVLKSFWVIDEMAKTANIPPNNFYYQTLEFQQELIIGSIIVAGIISTLLAIMFTLIFTHKSLGAIFRLKSFFLDMTKSGYTQKLSFRNGDLHDELPDIINEALDKVRNKN